jgi:hypothetical protein
MMNPRHRRGTRPARAALAAIVAAALLAGCGGSAGTGATNRATGARSATRAARTTSQRSEVNGMTLASIAASNPCSYVRTSDAAAILRAPSVKETEAPLGPTCIITAAGQPHAATLAVEVLPAAQALRAMKHVSRTSIAGHSAYCGTIGDSILLVPIAGAITLDVSAPCPQARALAALALSRIKT